MKSKFYTVMQRIYLTHLDKIKINRLSGNFSVTSSEWDRGTLFPEFFWVKAWKGEIVSKKISLNMKLEIGMFLLFVFLTVVFYILLPKINLVYYFWLYESFLHRIIVIIGIVLTGYIIDINLRRKIYKNLLYLLSTVSSVLVWSYC